MEWNAVRKLNGSAIKLHQKICSTEWTGKSVWVTSPNTYLEFCHLSSSSTYFPKHNSDVWFHILASMQQKWLTEKFCWQTWRKKRKKKSHLTLQPVRAKTVARDKCFSFLAFSYFARQSHRLQFDNILQDIIRRRWWKAMDFHVINKWMAANNISL